MLRADTPSSSLVAAAAAAAAWLSTMRQRGQSTGEGASKKAQIETTLPPTAGMVNAGTERQTRLRLPTCARRALVVVETCFSSLNTLVVV